MECPICFTKYLDETTLNDHISRRHSTATSSRRKPAKIPRAHPAPAARKVADHRDDEKKNTTIIDPNDTNDTNDIDDTNDTNDTNQNLNDKDKDHISDKNSKTL